jgi:hypothetical protein
MPSALPYWIYRDGREQRDGRAVLAELCALVAAVAETHGDRARRRAVDALIACGELEAALADTAHSGTAEIASATDELASAALGGACDAQAICARLASLGMPATVSSSVPEGFAYYALHPEAYAIAATNLVPKSGSVLVVGVRSIGTTLSAIARAALAARGVRAWRMTVRPRGAPYSRRLDLDDEQRAAVLRARDRGASVLVVDEGPGISGSTFLATAEAISATGFGADDRITLVCSHEPRPETLAAPDAALRFARFGVAVAPCDVHVPESALDLSAGSWRSHVYDGTTGWPASFTQTERRKLLLSDSRLAKFEGLGRSGRAAIARAASLAAAELAPEPRDEGDGWVSYRWAGAPLHRSDLDVDVIDRLAAYCAKRSALCPGNTPSPDFADMVAKNLELALTGTGVGAMSLALPIERLCVTDGRMAPHEWLRRDDGSLVKSDGIAHGDDHFFPGPTDIAWDLGGAVVEWGLDRAATERLLTTYWRLSGDHVRPRLAAWTLAYAVFRLAFSQVGLDAATGSPDEATRLARDVDRYRTAARSLALV